MEGSTFLRAIAVVVLALAAIACGYHTVYWYWISISSATPADAQLAMTREHGWLGAGVVIGLAWMYLSWKVLMDDRTAGNGTIKKKDTTLR